MKKEIFKFKGDAEKRVNELLKEGFTVKNGTLQIDGNTDIIDMDDAWGETSSFIVEDEDLNTVANIGWWVDVDEDDQDEYESLLRARKEEREWLVVVNPERDSYQYFWGVTCGLRNECVDCPNGPDDFCTREDADSYLEEAVEIYGKECAWLEKQDIAQTLENLEQ